MNKSSFFHTKRKWQWLLCSTVMLSLYASAQTSIPHLETLNGKTQLIVNGKPFLILGGELGNSAASSRAYIQSTWNKLKEINLNTVLMPVYWELIEPEEKKFDFLMIIHCVGMVTKTIRCGMQLEL